MKIRNPFAQSKQYWTVRFLLPAKAAQMAADSFSDLALSVSSFEVDEAQHIWSAELLFDGPPDSQELKRRLILLCALHQTELPKIETARLEQKDWQGQVAQSFPPIRAGRIFVHGAHSKAEVPYGVIPVQVDAGAAFGSGDHGTTRCCLLALDWLAAKRQFARVLDMGCGSGILAIAAAKLWNAEVVASDIDEVAVRVTKDNIRINQVSQHITALVSDGYANPAIRRVAPYNLIISNILARPLVQLAPKARAHLAPGGMMVLSGLLRDQERFVAQAYHQQRLYIKKRFIDGGWCTLVLGS